jgi:hypothetical protein
VYICILLTFFQRNIFVNIWETKGDGYVSTLKEKHFGFPPQVTDVKWELHIPLASVCFIYMC